MRRFLIAVFLLAVPLAFAAGTRASAQAPTAPVGDPVAGKVHYTFGNTSCSNCHGVDGEGRFGPPLAGRKIPYNRFRAYVRNPLGRMFSYPETELTDQEIADMVAYFDTLTAGAKPPTAEWRTPLPKMAPRGQQLAGGIWGCTQCHGITLDTPRHGAAEVTGDFEWFKRMVYDHTKSQREQMAMLDPNLPRVTPSFGGPATRMPPRIRMGNYNRARLPESTLKEIYDWMIDLGRLPVLNARVTANAPDASGATYTMLVTNAAVKDKGVGVQGLQVALALPAGAKVVKTTGEGYQGVRHDEEAKADVAVWKIASLPAAAQQTLTVTLAAPAPQLRGRMTWETPAVKADPEVDFAYSATGGRGRGGA
jgi:mono/diheme cytochrome c family protein